MGTFIYFSKVVSIVTERRKCCKTNVCSVGPAASCLQKRLKACVLISQGAEEAQTIKTSCLVFSRKPLCVMGCPRKLPVFLRSNSDKNHQAIKLNVMVINIYLHLTYEFPGGSDGKASAYNVGDPGLIPGLGRSPGEGSGNPLQYSYKYRALTDCATGASHSSILAWRIPRMEEPGRLQSIGSQRVGHN